MDGERGVISESCGLCEITRPRGLLRLNPLTGHWICADAVACCARFLTRRVQAAGR